MLTDEFGNVGCDTSSTVVAECLTRGHEASSDALAATSELVELSPDGEAAAFDTYTDTSRTC